MVFDNVPSSEKTSVIFFGLDIARDKMQMGFTHYLARRLSCRGGYGDGQVLPLRSSPPSEKVNPPAASKVHPGSEMVALVQKGIESLGTGKNRRRVHRGRQRWAEAQRGTEMCCADKRAGLARRREGIWCSLQSRAGRAVGPSGVQHGSALCRTEGPWERQLQRDGPNYVMQRFWILSHG